ncbi:hypothetical protein N7462_006472 [Penicillium macrosclerotiorum]|uniref:uncharacterized protein n=1 Tax=Penicillium macrosclerotiorum TaxID=303699 RepID=UPI00254725B5|nr:uncharacterized protein N7462_006472 [Penicillium macrosclerotiorum]KAJ5683307.1 hypothetical protein N7462_006472 [Penicillium macrosclerotiorum]
MATAQVPILLRFLTQDAKIPLTVAIGKTFLSNEFVLTNISPESIAKSNPKVLQNIFENEKFAKQVLNAGKRVSKKRGASADNSATSPQKKKKQIITTDTPPFEIESHLRLPVSVATDKELRDIVITTNRAPLVLAFAVCVLKYTMPEQPISSRLSLAQALVSLNSRSKAVSLGIESGPSAEQEGWGQGHPTVKVLGREIQVLKRWDYNPHEGKPNALPENEQSHSDTVPADEFLGRNCDGEMETMPPLWGVDLESARASHKSAAGADSNFDSRLPIFTAEAARTYLMRSITKSKHGNMSSKPRSVGSIQEEKEECVGHLLSAIESVCLSWVSTLDKKELDKRAWSWYLHVRPDVQSGVQGWGEKGQVKLSDILDLRRVP